MKIEKLFKILNRVIMSPQTMNIARFSEKFFTRNRKMPFQAILCFFFDMRKTSLQTRLNNFLRGGKVEKMSEQAISKARNKFDHSPFETMVRELVKEGYSSPEELPMWNGFHLLADDGSYLQLPKTVELREEFGVRGEGGTCISAGISVLYDLLTGWPIDPSITHSDMNEREEHKKHIDFLCRELPHIASKSLVLLDRGYPSKDLLEDLENKGIKYLVRCAKNFCKVSEDAPMGDFEGTLGNGLRVRIYKFRLSSGETETLLTNLFEMPSAVFPELYSMRWGIETYYDRLKNLVCVENFSGRTANAVRQDYWVSMVLMITIAVFQKEADEKLREEQDQKQNKNEYRAKTSDLVVTLRDRFIFNVLRQDPLSASKAIQEIISVIAYSKSTIRPNRSFPRRNDNHNSFNLNLKSHL